MTTLSNESDNLLSLEREVVSSSSSSVFQNLELGLGVLGDKEFFNGDPLSIGFKKTYGFHFNDEVTVNEVRQLTAHRDILELIQEQRIYHINGLCNTFDIPQSTVRRVQRILIRRGLLKVLKWTGRAKRTFGMMLIVTQDCTREDIESYMIDSMAIDDLRLAYELKNRKPRKTPAEVVKHNQEVKRLNEEAKQQEKHDLDQAAAVDPHLELCSHGVPYGRHTTKGGNTFYCTLRYMKQKQRARSKKQEEEQ